jgi:regulator of replication initiation timing
MSSKLRNERKKTQRAQTKVGILTDSLNLSRNNHSQAESSLHSMTLERDNLASQLNNTTNENQNLRHKADHLQNRVTQRVKRAPLQIERVVSKAVSKKEKEDNTFHIKENGAVTPLVRDIVMDMTAEHSVTAASVGPLLHLIAEGMGKTVEGKISPRTVGRISKEAGQWSRAQVGYKMKKANSAFIL